MQGGVRYELTELDSTELNPYSNNQVAAAGYPMNPRKGDAISGLPAPSDDAMVFHAGTVQQDGVTLTSGGRVLCVTALADSVKAAQQRAYQVVQGIRFDGAQYRRDIGHRAAHA